MAASVLGAVLPAAGQSLGRQRGPGQRLEADLSLLSAGLGPGSVDTRVCNVSLCQSDFNVGLLTISVISNSQKNFNR